MWTHQTDFIVRSILNKGYKTKKKHHAQTTLSNCTLFTNIFTLANRVEAI